MPLEKMNHDMKRFSEAYDNLVVKGHIMDEAMENTLGEKGTISDTDNMMNQLKAEVAFELTGQVNVPADQNLQEEKLV